MRITVDSNILVYAADRQAGERHEQALDLLSQAARADCILTLQVLGEFFHVATRKLRIGARDVRIFVDDWRDVFPVFAATESCLDRAMDHVARHGIAFWDAMLWATAREADCRLLLSEDLQDGRTLGGVTCVNPFEPANAVVIETALPRAD